MMYKRIKNDQRGMVAIVTTMILMIVISLIVLGFSQVARRNQRQAVDAQLASQAFYAAESGINLAKAELKADVTYTKSPGCGPDARITSYGVDTSGSAAITCLLVTPVNNLVFDNIGATSKASLIQPQSGTVNTIFINWESTADGNVAGCTMFPAISQSASWTASCNQPLLRIDLVPLPSSLSLTNLRTDQYTAFLYPDTSSSATHSTVWGASTGATGRGTIVRTKCDDTITSDKVRKCMTQITNLPGGSNRFGIRMMSLYGTSRVEIHVRDGSGVQPNLVGAQTLVDSTAKASDVLKRVQARVSTLPDTFITDFAIMSDDLCKRYLIDTSTNTADVDVSVPAETVAACRL